MSLWVKKPVVVEAFCWTGGPDQTEDPEWAIEAINKKRIMFTESLPRQMVIDTLEGRMKADQGDWIIRGVKGEIYPCKPDIFALTYEAAP